MSWEQEAESALEQLCAMVPETYRELARANARCGIWTGPSPFTQMAPA